MSVTVMTVTYEVEAGELALFRASISKHAETTRQREGGCLRYDVNYGIDRATLCLTYALFDSVDAYEQHVASDHYSLFDQLSNDWVVSRIEQLWELGASPRRIGPPTPA